MPFRKNIKFIVLMSYIQNITFTVLILIYRISSSQCYYDVKVKQPFPPNPDWACGAGTFIVETNHHAVGEVANLTWGVFTYPITLSKDKHQLMEEN